MKNYSDYQNFSHQMWNEFESGGETSEGTQDWMISFADLMAILLSFMIVSFAMNTVEDGLWEDISEGLKSAFNGQAEGGSEGETLGGRGKEALAGSYVADILVSQISGLGAEGAVSLLPNGDVRIDISRLVEPELSLSQTSEMLSRFGQQVIVKVVGVLPGEKASSVQRLMAWEQTMAEAVLRRDGLVSSGLGHTPKISVSLSDEPGGTSLLIKPIRAGSAS